MANVKEAFGASAQAITITLASLASSQTVGRASTAVDNTTNLFGDALVSGFFKLASGTPANAKGIYVFAYGTADGGTTYTDGATGTDAGFTRTDPPNLPLIGFVNTPAGAAQYNFGPFSVAAAFGGTLPDHWGIVVINFSGLAMDSTEANHKKVYQGVYATVA